MIKQILLVTNSQLTPADRQRGAVNVTNKRLRPCLMRLRLVASRGSILLVLNQFDSAFGDVPEVLAVRALAVALGGLHELVAGDPPVLVGDLLDDGDGQALRLLHRAHELARLKQAVHGAGVKPRVATAHEVVERYGRENVSRRRLANGLRPGLENQPRKSSQTTFTLS